MAKDLVPLKAAPDRHARGTTLPATLSKEARQRYAEFLPANQAVIERAHSPLARTLTYVLTGLILVLIAYISIAKVDQVATAAGVVRPDGRVKVVNHPEGGRISAIHVREGDRVTEGQVLLELDPEVMNQEVEKRRAEWITLELTVIRLQAEIAGIPPTFPTDLTAERPDLVSSQLDLYNARSAAIAGKRNEAAETVHQHEQEVAGLEQSLVQQRESLALLQQQVDSLRKLKEQGYFPELRYLSVLRELSDAEGKLNETQVRLDQARSALVEAQSRLAQVDSDYQAQVQGELTENMRARDQARASLQQSDTVLGNLTVVSPAAGVVQELKINNLGQSVSPNEELMKIVPVGETLIIEAKVLNADIGKIEIGQKARVKITTYNYVHYGVLEGEVVQISPDAVADQRTGQLLFSVMVRTTKTYLGSTPDKNVVTPGMTAEVDLVIGRRTILSYLTDRFRQTAQEAFTEN